MKKSSLLLLLLPAVALTAAAGWYGRGSRQPEPAPAGETLPLRAGPPPSRILTDPAAVFTRAFRREPAAGDVIAHAERQEWSDAGGVTKWAWFLEVNASPELLKYLVADNSFGLVPGPAGALPEGRPSWLSYDPAGVRVFRSPRGNLRLILSKQGNKLFATDSGSGFRRGAPAPVAADSAITRQAPAPGRLPATSPPKPSP